MTEMGSEAGAGYRDYCASGQNSHAGGDFLDGESSLLDNHAALVWLDRAVEQRAMDTGEKLLDIQTGLRGGMGPPVTYMLDGKQYVTLLGGTGRVRPRITGDDDDKGKGGALPDAPVAPTGPVTMPKVLTFVLNGTMPLPAPAGR